MLAETLAGEWLRSQHAGDDHCRDALNVIAENRKVATVSARRQSILASASRHTAKASCISCTLSLLIRQHVPAICLLCAHCERKDARLTKVMSCAAMSTLLPKRRLTACKSNHAY